MKIKTFFISIPASAALICLSQLGGCAGEVSQNDADFQIVESVPFETVLGSPDIPRTLDIWLEMINGARKSLDIETFYISGKNGSRMEKVLSAIEKAAKRNVKVRIIVDSSFYRIYPNPADRLNKVKGISLRVIPFSKLTGGIMHAKFFIVDKREVFVGSQNLDWRALEHIHEIGTRVFEPETAGTFLEVFETDWELCKSSRPSAESSGSRSRLSRNIGKPQSVPHPQSYQERAVPGRNGALPNGEGSPSPKAEGSEVVRDRKMRPVNAGNPVVIKSEGYGKISVYPAFTPKSLLTPGLSWELDEILRLINNSKKEILIQAMSFSPFKYKKKTTWHAIDNALKKAAKKGVKVKLLLSNWTIKSKTMNFLRELSSVSGLELRIITIPQHSSGFIPFSRVDHSKYMVADGNKSIISTSNWEWGYFHESRNAALVITGKSAGRRLSKIFYQSWDSPYSLPFDPKKKYKPARKAK